MDSNKLVVSPCPQVDPKSLTKKGRSLDHIPLSQNASQQHAKRATFQGGQVWGQCRKLRQNLPSPAQWGRECRAAEDEWQPVWTTIPIAAEAACLLRLQEGLNGSQVQMRQNRHKMFQFVFLVTESAVPFKLYSYHSLVCALPGEGGSCI